MPRIASETIERVAEANDIVEVVNSYFPLKRAGSAWRALCPFHREKSPSFHVNPQRQSFHCFGCGAGGNVISFVRDYEHLDFVSAVRKLAQRAGVPIIEDSGGPEDDRRHDLRKRLLALHAETTAWFQQNLLRSPDAAHAREYLQSRGLTSDVAKSWQLGYAPDSWDALLHHLREKRFSNEEIAQSGVAASKDSDDSEPSRNPHLYARFRDRVIFPIRNDYGEVIAFSGRVLNPDAKAAKYVNSPETPLFTKGKVLYGLDKSKRALIDAKTAIVCEGQIDLISAFESGVQNVIAPQGTAFTSDQARVLQRFVETVVLCFDSDRAGQQAVTRSLPALLAHGLEVRVARLPEGQDPDSLIRGQGPDAFRAAISSARNFFDHALAILDERGLLHDPAGKASAAKRLGPHVANITDQVLREATVKKICTRLGVSEKAFSVHLTSPSSRNDESSLESDRDEVPPVVMNHAVSHLCRLALLHPEARAWMRDQSLPGDETSLPGSGILQKILVSPLELEKPAARAAFGAELSTPEAVAISRLDLDRVPVEPLRTAQDLWNGLSSQLMSRRVEETRNRQNDRSLGFHQMINLQMSVLEGRLKGAEAQLQRDDESLSKDEKSALEDVVKNLSKQILDLQSRLHDA